MVNKVLWVHGTPACDTLCRLRKAAWISSFNCMDGYGGIPNVQANLVPRAFPHCEQGCNQATRMMTLEMA